MYASWLHRVVSQTRAHHAAADAQRLAIMDASSPAHYRAFLERVWGFESWVEMRASSIEGLELAAAGARLRVARLHEDLVGLGLTPLDVASLPHASFEIPSLPEGLGWLLVIERHVLLAGLIRRHLASELGEPFVSASRYLAAHRDGGTRMRELGDVLADAIMRGRARPEAIVAAARVAFEAQLHWYSRVPRVRGVIAGRVAA